MITFPLFFRLRQRHILEAHLSLRDGLPVLAPSDGDAPELLRTSLDDRLSDDIHRALTHCPQESVELLTPTANCPCSKTAADAPTLATLSMVVV